VASFGVTVNCIIPGYTRTERLVDLAEARAARTGETIEEIYDAWANEAPMGRLAEPEELGAMAAFLCSEKAAYVIGQSVAVDGGWIKGLF
jgi:3-oxoacyl-[acyl-carrier protein] reductase